MMRRYARWVVAAGLVILCLAAHTPRAAVAASLSFSPSSETVAVGQAFTVAVDVSSPDQAMNAASGDVSFPTSELRVIAVSKLNSILNLWVRDPSFSNTTAEGDVHFEGIVLNPGFIGAKGTLVQITFQVVGAVGDHAALAFSSGSVLANDGNGTEILTAEGTADFTIVAAPPAPAPPVLVSPASSSVASSSAVAPAVATEPPPASASSSVTVNGWFGGATAFFSAWGLIALLVLLLLAAIIALIVSLTSRPRRSIIRERKELREDLQRIEKELEADRPRTEIDLSASGMRKKQEKIQKEIAHLEEDLKGDMKEGER